MSYAFESGRLIKTAFLAIMVLVIMLLGSMQAVGADGHGGGHGDGYRGGHGRGYRFYDTRYNHRRYYPARGRYVYQLPHGYRMVSYHNSRYFFYGGVWYHPEGGRFCHYCSSVRSFSSRFCRFITQQFGWAVCLIIMPTMFITCNPEMDTL